MSRPGFVLPDYILLPTNMNLKLLNKTDLESVARRLYGDPMQQGWRIRSYHRFGYYSPQTWYEAVVDRLVTPKCRWLDIGGGKSVFPHNAKLAKELAQRCTLLVGVDPSDNIYNNTVIHHAEKCMIEDFHSDNSFDLATMRMVAEHITDPKVVVAALARLVKPGGYVVIFTPNRWSVVPLMASLIPNKLHSFFTHLLWNTVETDVFPTFYKMNTRKRLRTLFDAGGFTEVWFKHLADCATLSSFKPTCLAELCLWRFFNSIGSNYPENNLLGVYVRRSIDSINPVIAES